MYISSHFLEIIFYPSSEINCHVQEQTNWNLFTFVHENKFIFSPLSHTGQMAGEEMFNEPDLHPNHKKQQEKTSVAEPALIFLDGQRRLF